MTHTQKFVGLLLLALLSLPLAGCFGGGGGDFPGSEAEIERQVSSNIAELSFNLSAEDVEAASRYVSHVFTMDPQVAAQFGGSFAGQGKSAFRAFFESLLEKYGDFSVIIGVNSVDVEGDVATAFVTVTFTAQDVTQAPPQTVQFTQQHVMVFEFEDGLFRLVNWGLPGSGHNQGGGGNI